MSEPRTPVLDRLQLSDEHDIDSAIAARERSYTNLFKELLRLRTHRNDTVPIISRIPNEILAQIFIHLVDDSFRINYLKWLHITHVCSRWRDVARNIPELWNVIPTGQHQECTETFIELSKDLPLSIFPTREHTGEFLEPKFLTTLACAADRIQHIELWLRVATVLGLSEYQKYLYWSNLADEAPDSAPILETIKLHLTSLDSDDADLIEQFWFFSRFASLPRLRTLHLTGFPPELTTSFLRSSIVELDISPQSSYTALQWRKRLFHLPLLERLTLDEIANGSSTRTVPADRMARLEHLRSIQLRPGKEGSPKACLSLLNYLLIPSTCEIYLGDGSCNSPFTLNVLSSKKDGRGCIGVPQPLVALECSSRPLSMRWWSTTDLRCLASSNRSGPSRVEQPNDTYAIDVMRITPEEFLSVDDNCSFLTSNIQLLCLGATAFDLRPSFSSQLLSLRELRIHGNSHRGWLITLKTLGLEDLPSLHALTLDTPKWHAHPARCIDKPFGGEPLSIYIDALLDTRRKHGHPIEQLHLHHIRFFGDEDDIAWSRRTSTELGSGFVWTLPPGDDGTWDGHLTCALCEQDPFIQEMTLLRDGEL